MFIDSFNSTSDGMNQPLSDSTNRGFHEQWSLDYDGLDTPTRQRFYPRYTALNNIAVGLVRDLAKTTGLTLSGKAGQKNNIILASFLFAAQMAQEKAFESGKSCLLVWLSGKVNKRIDGYLLYPNVGDTALKNAREALMHASLIERLSDPAQSVPKFLSEEEAADWFFDQPENQDLSDIERSFVMHDGITLPSLMRGTYPEQTTYRIRLSEGHREALRVAAFNDSNRPALLVNRSEAVQHPLRDLHNLPRKKMTQAEMKTLPRGSLKARQDPVIQLSKLWAKHPLVLPATEHHAGRAFSCMTRIFHHGRLTHGGRYYAGYTNIPGDERLRLTIDGEPIAEIDFNASQPTLFSTLLGMKMDVPEVWTDAYANVMQRLSGLEEPYDVLRSRVKAVCVELIGSGVCSKDKPSLKTEVFNPKHYPLPDIPEDERRRELIQQYRTIRDAVLQTFPALRKLTPKHYNGAGFLSFHESEILTGIMLALSKQGIVSYGMHDCLIVKQRDIVETIKVIRQETLDYLLKHQKKHSHPRLPLTVGLSVKCLDTKETTLCAAYTDDIERVDLGWV